jgi:hypothetical protein
VTRPRHVQQDDYAGCMVACLAMVTGKSYAEVKAWEGFSGKNFRDPSQGLTYHDAMQYLTDHGFATALRFRWLPGCKDDGHHTRDPWPTAPYAPAHIISVQGSRHAVVLLPDGAVFDPQQATPRHIGEFGVDVAYMIGVFKVQS